MLISLTMSSAREHPPKDCVGSLAQLSVARFVFYNYTWELDLKRTMGISYQHGYISRRLPLVRSRIRSLESTYDLRRPYCRRRNDPERRRRAKGRLARLLQ
jgi:hypothetical protein